MKKRKYKLTCSCTKSSYKVFFHKIPTKMMKEKNKYRYYWKIKHSLSLNISLSFSAPKIKLTKKLKWARNEEEWDRVFIESDPLTDTVDLWGGTHTNVGQNQMCVKFRVNSDPNVGYVGSGCFRCHCFLLFWINFRI